MSEGTFYKMSDAELSAVRIGIQQTLLRKGEPDQKARGIASKYDDDNTLNYLASCTLEMKNRLYPKLDNFDVIDAIINYGDGMTVEDKGLNNIAYRILTRWHEDHNIEKPAFIDGIPNNEKKLSEIMLKYATEANPKGYPKPSLMAGYSRVVPSDKQRRKQATQPDPSEPEPNWFAWWLMMNGGSPFTKIWTIDDTEPANPYRGLVGLDMSSVHIPIPTDEGEDEGDGEDEVDLMTLLGVKPFIPTKKLNPPTETENIIGAMIDAGCNVFIAGPPGLGKTYSVEQYCIRHRIPLFMCTSPQMSVDITGYTDANGKYVPSEFVKGCVYKGKCVILIEEIDRSLPDALIPMNSAIANGILGTLGLGTISVNPDAIFIATGNTNGLGATDDITTAQQLDGSTLDRFVTEWVDWNHDVAMGRCKDNAKLVEFAEDYRRAHMSKGFSGGNITYRALQNITALENAKFEFTTEMILQRAVIKHMLTRNDLGTIISLMTCTSNPYYKALYKIWRDMDA